MTENQLTRRLLDRTSQLLPGSFYFKHADQSTAGVPDFSISWRGYTWWGEAKYLRKDQTLKEQLSKVQEITLRLLYRATQGRAVIMVFTHDNLLILDGYAQNVLRTQMGPARFQLLAEFIAEREA